MEQNTALIIAGFLLTAGSQVFFSGRFIGGLRQIIEANERVRKAEREADLIRLAHMEDEQRQLRGAVVEKRDELRRSLEQQLSTMTSEIMALRTDRHATTGTVMRHEGTLGEIRKEIGVLEGRMSRIEDIQRVRRSDLSPPA